MEDPSFEDWYGGTYQSVVAAMVVISGDSDLARDATDEAFTRALARWSRVGVMESPSGWTFRVALNEVRRRQRRRTMERRLLGTRHAPPDLPPASLELWSLVGELPPRQRTAVILRYVGDLPEADIASAMDITRGTVSATLASAMTKLRAALAEPDEGEVLRADS
jgi:DNA-directed RNA polymerase specialized sigma24 family protein